MGKRKGDLIFDENKNGGVIRDAFSNDIIFDKLDFKLDDIKKKNKK